MARTATRLYVPLDVSFFDDEKVIQAGEKATYLYLAMLTKAKQLDTDGVLTAGQIAKLSIDSPRGTAARLKSLLEVEMVVEVPMARDTYAIVAWHKWNESRDDRASRLEADRRRKAQIKAANA